MKDQRNMKKNIFEVETAENLGELKKGVLAVFKDIENELNWLNYKLEEKKNESNY